MKQVINSVSHLESIIRSMKNHSMSVKFYNLIGNNHYSVGLAEIVRWSFGDVLLKISSKSLYFDEDEHPKEMRK